MNNEVSTTTQALLEASLIADLTAPSAPLGQLAPDDASSEAWVSAYEAAGCDWVSFTVAEDFYAQTVESCILAIANARSWFLSRPERFVLIEKTSDIERARSSAKMAVSLHFQGTLPFQQNVKLVEVYKRLGVVHALMAYNRKNLVGDGCHERTDAGLSSFGLELIAEMNRVGMLVDVTHTGYRTAMEAIAASAAPVIMSHSSPRAVWDHERNVPDDQIVAMANSGGVMGVHGVGIFMTEGGLDVSAGRIVDFIRHGADLVGPQHIGLGLDYVMHTDILQAFIAQAGSVYKAGGGYSNEQLLFAPPTVIAQIAELLLQQNFPETAVQGILGENWLRVFRQVWG